MLLVACAGMACPPASVAPEARPTARPGPPEPPPERATELPCPIVPMRLVVDVPGQPPTTLLTLDESGALRLALPVPSKDESRLDARGCALLAGEVAAERLPNGDIWTLRQKLRVDGRRIHAHGDRWHRIEPNGEVVDSDAQGSRMRFEGFEPRGLCAAQLMWATVGAVFGGASMAVVDGVAETLPPPDPSVCPEHHGR